MLQIAEARKNVRVSAEMFRQRVKRIETAAEGLMSPANMVVLRAVIWNALREIDALAYEERIRR